MEQEDKIRLKVREHGIVLAGGLLVIGFCLFILVMGLRYPSAKGNRLVFALVLFLMTVCGMIVCAMYFCRSLTVEEMNICYVNLMGKRKEFTLDDVGYCKLRFYGSKREPILESFTLYDLLGDKLCKLEMNMPGAGEFLQYLLDNQIKTERPGAEQEKVVVTEPILLEKAICKEEICKYAEAFCEMISPVFIDWERRYRRFDAQWEFGLAEYAQGDIMADKDMWQWESKTQGVEELPEDYICVGEAYLKRGEEYVMTRKGEAVGLLIPYIRQTRSYQIGERKRIRKSDETLLKERLSIRLEQIAKELPRHTYHTRPLTLAHALNRTAGIAAGTGAGMKYAADHDKAAEEKQS